MNIINKLSILNKLNIINIIIIINIINKINKQKIQTIRNIQDIQIIQSIVYQSLRCSKILLYHTLTTETEVLSQRSANTTDNTDIISKMGSELKEVLKQMDDIN